MGPTNNARDCATTLIGQSPLSPADGVLSQCSLCHDSNCLLFLMTIIHSISYLVWCCVIQLVAFVRLKFFFFFSIRLYFFCIFFSLNVPLEITSDAFPLSPSWRFTALSRLLRNSLPQRLIQVNNSSSNKSRISCRTRVYL